MSFLNVKIRSAQKSLIAVVAVGLALAACEAPPYQPYARDVKRKPGQGGSIALRLEHQDADRQKAMNMMSSNCGSSKVKVLEEGEVEIGQETQGSATASRDEGSAGTVGKLFGMKVRTGQKDPSTTTNSNSRTMAVKEWQISYECEVAAAPSATPRKAR